MRLLNTTTLELKEFFDKSIPQYAILSHTWDEDEITFDELQAGTRKSKGGYKKIELCCSQALKDGWSWAWVDTCCIQKASSAELSEAINSMFRWYKNSEVCYVYLTDVPDGVKKQKSALSKSRWLTRGWTLQELLAPRHVTFYSEGWRYLGTKIELASVISKATGIDDCAINFTRPLEWYSIAQRMSWASRRETTRLEDTAYSLLGLFDVNMPLLYGEGDKAFERLQGEIMKTSSDHSLFAWKALAPSKQQVGLLAPSPAEFLHSARIGGFGSNWYYPTVNTNVTTNRGIQVELHLQSIHDGHFGQVSVALLACEQQDPTDRHLTNGVAIIMRLRDGIYSRVEQQHLLSIPYVARLSPYNFKNVSQLLDLSAKQVHVPKAVPSSVNCLYVFCIEAAMTADRHANGQWNWQPYVVDAIHPPQRTPGFLFVSLPKKIFSGARAVWAEHLAGSILLRRSGDRHRDSKNEYVTVFVGHSQTGQPWCHLIKHKRIGDKSSFFTADRGKKHRATPQFGQLPDVFSRNSYHELEVEPKIKMTVEILEQTKGFVGEEVRPQIRTEGEIRSLHDASSEQGIRMFRVVLKVQDGRDR